MAINFDDAPEKPCTPQERKEGLQLLMQVFTDELNKTSDPEIKRQIQRQIENATNELIELEQTLAWIKKAENGLRD